MVGGGGGVVGVVWVGEGGWQARGELSLPLEHRQ